MRNSRFLRGFGITVMNLLLAGVFAVAADRIGLEKEIVLMIFLLEVLFTTVAAGGPIFASFTALYAFLVINYFFTPPRYDFRIATTGDLIALITFLATAVVVGTIVSDLRRQRELAEEGEKAARELVRVREQEEKARSAAEREELRSTLLRSVAHDLRSPLTALSGTSRMLEEDYDRFSDEERRRFLSDMSEEILWLSSKVENILSKTILDEKNILLHKESEAVDDIVGEAVARMRRLLRGRPFSVGLPDEVLMVPMDGNLIVQVLINLLGNAVRHTPSESAVALSVSREGDSAVFCVSDTGTGIDPAIRDTLFDRFVTRDADSPDRRRGIGLGLAICRTIVEAHGGTITAEDNEPHGAVFRFTLPLETESDEGFREEKERDDAGKKEDPSDRG